MEKMCPSVPKNSPDKNNSTGIPKGLLGVTKEFPENSLAFLGNSSIVLPRIPRVITPQYGYKLFFNSLVSWENFSFYIIGIVLWKKMGIEIECGLMVILFIPDVLKLKTLK